MTDHVEEKQRVATLLSSIKTPEELDAIHAKETGTTLSTDGEEPMNDDFVTACNLLRSTAPRQTLWAARIVCQRLEEDVAAKKSVRIDNGGNNNDTTWPYPTVLPVSLRCLLDSPVSQSNGFLLHTYVHLEISLCSFASTGTFISRSGCDL